MTKDKDIPYITKLHPVYGIKLYSIDGSTWSTNPAELALIQERLEKGLVGSIDKRMIPPRKKVGQRPSVEAIEEVEPENEEGEVPEEGLEVGLEVDDEEEEVSPHRAAGGSRDKRIGDALRLIGDELGGDENDFGDDFEVSAQPIKAPVPVRNKKSEVASPRAGTSPIKRGASSTRPAVAKKSPNSKGITDLEKAPPLAASAKKTKTGDSSERKPVTTSKQPPKLKQSAPAKEKKPAILKASSQRSNVKQKKGAVPPKKGAGLVKKVAQGGAKRAASTKSPVIKSSKGRASPQKAKNGSKSAPDKKQSGRRVVKKAR